MSNYESKKYPVDATPEQVYAKLSNPGALGAMIEGLPEAAREKLSSVKFESDSVSLDVPMVGAIKMKFTERVEPSKIVIGPESSPVPFNMIVNIGRGNDGKATIATAMDVELNMFLRSMVGSKIEEGIEKVAEMLTHIPY